MARPPVPGTNGSSLEPRDFGVIADRRHFLKATASAFAALAASGCMRARLLSAQGAAGYGPLVSDPAGLLDLPEGFTYRVLSSLGDRMDDGGTVPDAADGMGSFDLGGGKIALVRNHELSPGQGAVHELTSGYRRDAQGSVLPGGTTTLVLDAATLRVERQFRSLAGTMRNCAGGITPWGSWLTCEEPGFLMGRSPDHGFVFEVPANATGLVDAVPLEAMGRFNHEAASVDPRTGMIYMTEDQNDGLLYRFIPNVRGKLVEGGRLQALAVRGIGDSRNWDGAAVPVGGWHEASWVDLDNVEAPEGDLRARGAAAGATVFARGEGLWMGDGELYFCCTGGGTAKLGQIFRLRPQAGGPDRLQLFFESESIEQFNFGDNLTIAPNGHLVVCEDQYTPDVANHLRGITPAGEAYPLGLCRLDTELAGACFSPDGRVLFVNIYGPAKTLAITGPWIA
jgi:secreted PhoX family phosphatase